MLEAEANNVWQDQRSLSVGSAQLERSIRFTMPEASPTISDCEPKVPASDKSIFYSSESA